MGRPTAYKQEYEKQVYKLCLLGLTDKQMSDIFGVVKTTFNTWKKKYPEFLASIKRGKDIADANVAASLYERACGYSHPEDKIFCTNGVVTVEPTTKHYPPDTAAAFIWLKNRQPNKWCDKPPEPIDSESAPTRYEIVMIDGTKDEDDAED